MLHMKVLCQEIHNKMSGNCPGLTSKALVKAHRNSRLQTQVFPTEKPKLFPGVPKLLPGGCTVIKEAQGFVFRKNHQLLQYKVKWLSHTPKRKLQTNMSSEPNSNLLHSLSLFFSVIYTQKNLQEKYQIVNTDCHQKVFPFTFLSHEKQGD